MKEWTGNKEQEAVAMLELANIRHTLQHIEFSSTQCGTMIAAITEYVGDGDGNEDN